jgi:hypothetical protein
VSNLREVFNMGKTMAEVLKEEGRAEGATQALRRALTRQIRAKFKRVPEGVVRRIENTTDVAQLDAWLDGFARARQLTDVGIPPLE